MIPYIEPSPDPLFQARLFIYPDTQRYRLGVNNKQLPCNAPAPNAKVVNFQRAGAGSFVSQGSRPNYQSTIQPIGFVGPPNAIDSQIRNNNRHERFDGTVYRDLTMVSVGKMIVELWFGKYADRNCQTIFRNLVTCGISGAKLKRKRLSATSLMASDRSRFNGSWKISVCCILLAGNVVTYTSSSFQSSSSLRLAQRLLDAFVNIFPLRPRTRLRPFSAQ